MPRHCHTPAPHPTFRLTILLMLLKLGQLHSIRFPSTFASMTMMLSKETHPSKTRIANTRTISGMSSSLGALVNPTPSSYTAKDAKLVQDMLYRVRNVNDVPMQVRESLIDFQVDGQLLGKVSPQMANILVEAGDAFVLQQQQQQQSLSTTQSPQTSPQAPPPPPILTLSASTGSSPESKTKAVDKVMQTLRKQGIVTGWRDEAYPVGTSFYQTPAFLVERAAAPLLGAIEYGVHINGLVQQPDGSVKMWMARRAKDKAKYPGMLDHIVAGGQPAGRSLMDNVVKECHEEANIPEALTRAGIRAAGAISYETYSKSKDTMTRAVLFNYDLYLPPDFQPTPVDGEVEEFFLWSVEEILASMDPEFHDPIKPNCYCVIIDWLLRQGYVSPEIPGYLDILRELRNGDCR